MSWDSLVDGMVRCLDALPDAARPHVTARGPAGQLVGPLAVGLDLASGARVELAAWPVVAWLAEHGAPSVDRIASALAPWVERLSEEPYDRYVVQGPEVAAVELRGMVPFSVLRVEVVVDEWVLEGLIVQDDEARWAAEDEGVLGPGFQDFAERNALWAGLGLRRPRDWSITVVGA